MKCKLEFIFNSKVEYILESILESNLSGILSLAWEDLYPILLFTGFGRKVSAGRIFDETRSLQVNNKNKQWSAGKSMWVFYVFLPWGILFALSVLCKSVQTDNVPLWCVIFCDHFPMYSLNIRCIRTYTSRKSICLHVLSFRHLFWRHMVVT